LYLRRLRLRPLHLEHAAHLAPGAAPACAPAACRRWGSARDRSGISSGASWAVGRVPPFCFSAATPVSDWPQLRRSAARGPLTSAHRKAQSGDARVEAEGGRDHRRLGHGRSGPRSLSRRLESPAPLPSHRAAAARPSRILRASVAAARGDVSKLRAREALSHCEIKIAMRCPPEDFEAAAMLAPRVHRRGA
jgi:hypothetical protein